MVSINNFFSILILTLFTKITQHLIKKICVGGEFHPSFCGGMLKWSSMACFLAWNVSNFSLWIVRSYPEVYKTECMHTKWIISATSKNVIWAVHFYLSKFLCLCTESCIIKQSIQFTCTWNSIKYAKMTVHSLGLRRDMRYLVQTVLRLTMYTLKVLPKFFTLLT